MNIKNDSMDSDKQTFPEWIYKQTSNRQTKWFNVYELSNRITFYQSFSDFGLGVKINQDCTLEENMSLTIRVLFWELDIEWRCEWIRRFFEKKAK